MIIDNKSSGTTSALRNGTATESGIGYHHARFPRFSRDQDRRCKLTEANIADIRRRYELGESQKHLAKEFGISQPAIHYWCLEDNARKSKNKAQNSGKKTQKDRGEYMKEYRRRKKSPAYIAWEYEKRMKDYRKHKEIYNERRRQKYADKKIVSQNNERKKVSCKVEKQELQAPRI